MKFEVWAPKAKSVDLVIGERRTPLQAHDLGSWQGEADIGADEGYRYSLDGGNPIPDPRSRWQPDGVHGPSHLVDATTLQGSEHSEQLYFRALPLREAIIYEMHVGTFTDEG